MRERLPGACQDGIGSGLGRRLGGAGSGLRLGKNAPPPPAPAPRPATERTAPPRPPRACVSGLLEGISQVRGRDVEIPAARRIEDRFHRQIIGLHLGQRITRRSLPRASRPRRRRRRWRRAAVDAVSRSERMMVSSGAPEVASFGTSGSARAPASPRWRGSARARRGRWRRGLRQGSPPRSPPARRARTRPGRPPPGSGGRGSLGQGAGKRVYLRQDGHGGVRRHLRFGQEIHHLGGSRRSPAPGGKGRRSTAPRASTSNAKASSASSPMARSSAHDHRLGAGLRGGAPRGSVISSSKKSKASPPSGLGSGAECRPRESSGEGVCPTSG